MRNVIALVIEASIARRALSSTRNRLSKDRLKTDPAEITLPENAIAFETDSLKAASKTLPANRIELPTARLRITCVPTV